MAEARLARFKTRQRLVRAKRSLKYYERRFNTLLFAEVLERVSRG